MNSIFFPFDSALCKRVDNGSDLGRFADRAGVRMRNVFAKWKQKRERQTEPNQFNSNTDARARARLDDIFCNISINIQRVVCVDFLIRGLSEIDEFEVNERPSE